MRLLIGWMAFLYEKPFGYALEHVKPEREKNRRASCAKSWWSSRARQCGPRSRRSQRVMPALVAGIHARPLRVVAWMAGTSPAMTAERRRVTS